MRGDARSGMRARITHRVETPEGYCPRFQLRVPERTGRLQISSSGSRSTAWESRLHAEERVRRVRNLRGGYLLHIAARTHLRARVALSVGTTRSGIESRTRELVAREASSAGSSGSRSTRNRACTSQERGTCEKSPIRLPSRSVARTRSGIESRTRARQCFGSFSSLHATIARRLGNGACTSRNGEHVRNLRFELRRERGYELWNRITHP